MPDLKRGSEVLDAQQCRVQIRDQTLQSRGMKPQVIVHQATSVQGCERLQRNGPESVMSIGRGDQILATF